MLVVPEIYLFRTNSNENNFARRQGTEVVSGLVLILVSKCKRTLVRKGLGISAESLGRGPEYLRGKVTWYEPTAFTFLHS